MLEGSQELSAGVRVKLDLSEVRQFTLFPGQVLQDKLLTARAHISLSLTITNPSQTHTDISHFLNTVDFQGMFWFVIV